MLISPDRDSDKTIKPWTLGHPFIVSLAPLGFPPSAESLSVVAVL